MATYTKVWGQKPKLRGCFRTPDQRQLPIEGANRFALVHQLAEEDRRRREARHYSIGPTVAFGFDDLAKLFGGYFF